MEQYRNLLWELKLTLRVADKDPLSFLLRLGAVRSGHSRYVRIKNKHAVLS